MTEKRFTRNGYKIWDNVKNEEFYELHFRYEVEDICDELNEYEEKVNELSKENNQLKREKERYKRLSEIRDENINNRILSIKEFINNCEDENVKNTLEDLFYSEVKEYDLAKENRKLKKDNEQLKFKLNECKEHKLFSRRQLKKENIMLKEEIETLHEQLVHGIEDLCGDD